MKDLGLYVTPMWESYTTRTTVVVWNRLSHERIATLSSTKHVNLICAAPALHESLVKLTREVRAMFGTTPVPASIQGPLSDALKALAAVEVQT